MKKLLSLVLAVVMVLGMTTVAFAAYTAPSGTDTNGKAYQIGKGAVGADQVFSLGEDVRPGDVIKLPLAYDGDDGNAVKAIEKGDVKTLKLGVKIQKRTSGGELIKSVQIKYADKAVTTNKYNDIDLGAIAAKQAYIEVKFIKPFVSIKDKDFDFDVVLTSGGKNVKVADENVLTSFVGTLANKSQGADEDTDEVWTSDGNIIEGDGYISNLEIHMEDQDTNDVASLFARVFSGKDYYAYVTTETDDKAFEVMTEYTDIEFFALFSTVNLSSGQLQFNYDDNLWAYSEDAEGNLVYVGRTDSKLPYYNRYYISTKELTLPVAEVEEPVDEPAPVEEPEDPSDLGNEGDGGDDYVEAPSEANNYNPGTGR